jgi:hypothetical protein
MLFYNKMTLSYNIPNHHSSDARVNQARSHHEVGFFLLLLHSGFLLGLLLNPEDGGDMYNRHLVIRRR